MKIQVLLNIIVIAISLCITTFAESFAIQIATLLIGLTCLVALAYSFLNSAEKIKTNDFSTKDAVDQEFFVELSQLFEILESAVKEDMDVVKQEIYQIKSLVHTAASQLSESFYAVSSNSEEQRRLLDESLQALNITSNNKTLSQFHQTHEKIQNNSAIAVQSLQFEDIVSQVSDNSIQYIDNLDNFLKDFKARLACHLKPDNYGQNNNKHLDTFLEDIKKIRQSRLLPDRKAAYQNNMSEGDIELF